MLRFGRCFALVLVFTLIANIPAGAGYKSADHHSDNRETDKGIETKTLQPVVLQPLVFKADDLEGRAFAAINEQRAAHGLQPLQPAQDLSAVARHHSQDMLARDYFAHQSPDGRDLRYRIARQGISNWRYLAENIAYNSGYDDPVTAAVEGWMNSPGHRKNILNPKLAESGLGVAVSDSGRIFFTQVFATRDDKATVASR